MTNLNLTNSSRLPLHDIIDQARQALHSTLIVYQDGDDEPGAMEQLIAYVQLLLNKIEHEATANHQQHSQLITLIQALKAQRDDAIQARDDALRAHQDAYLEGLLTAEEERLNTDWKSFGVGKEFSLDWLQELLYLVGEDHAANAVANAQRILNIVCSKAEAHLQSLHAKHYPDEIPF